MAKLRERKRLGMDAKGVDPEQFEDVFSLATIKSREDLERAAEGGRNEENEGSEEEEEAAGGGGGGGAAGAEDEGEDDAAARKRHLAAMEADMDSQYDAYLLANKKARTGTKMAKRSKKEAARKLARMEQEDTEAMAMEDVDGETKEYAKMLSGKRDSDDSGGESSSDDGFFSDGDAGEGEPAKKARRGAKANPLIVKFDDESRDKKVSRFMANPLFDGLEDEEEEEEGGASGSDSDSGAGSRPAKKKGKKAALSADDVLAMMPKTDKELRHEKRKMANERMGRRDQRREKIAGDAMEIVAAENNLSSSKVRAPAASEASAGRGWRRAARRRADAGADEPTRAPTTAFSLCERSGRE
jgi:hypothetical protein